MERLIKSLKDQGLITTAIKHHGHGGKPDIVQKKDSTKYLTAGAAASIIEGDGRLILQVEEGGHSLEAQIELMNFFHPDVILIEGYKQKNYPKLVILRDLDDLSLLKNVSNVKAVVYWQENMSEGLSSRMNLPHFYIEDESAICWIIELIKKSVL